MKALVLPAVQATPEIREVPLPTPGPGEARVRLAASALNHRDVWIQQGKYPGIKVPITLGSDGVGVVEAVGSDSDSAWLGQRVLLCPSVGWGDDPRHQAASYEILGLPRDGTFAEAIALPVENLVACPAHLDDAAAAALPLAGLTAWRALMTRAALRPGERVLITGIGGGTALAALQIAVAAGAAVAVTSSDPAKIERAMALGAAGGELYTAAGWSGRVRSRFAPRGFDVVIDSAGGEGFGELPGLLAMGGRIAFFGGTRGKWPPILPQLLFYKQVSLLATTMGSPAEFAALVAFVAEHGVVPVVDACYPLEEGAAAFARLAAGAQFGKVVLKNQPAA
ncbi:MAG: zinc-binding dehydrogenase [Myxococcales bacterium]|nr:zinc-binding dehydrogenase [Myxococcales bacterium]